MLLGFVFAGILHVLNSSISLRFDPMHLRQHPPSPSSSACMLGEGYLLMYSVADKDKCHLWEQHMGVGSGDSGK